MGLGRLESERFDGGRFPSGKLLSSVQHVSADQNTYYLDRHATSDVKVIKEVVSRQRIEQ